MTVIRTEPLPGERSPGWGDEFSAICDSHRGRLVRWLTAIFGPRDAEDIAQEALARLYVRPGLLGDDADAWPWLAVVARNVGRDMMRHRAYTTTVDSATLDQFPTAAGVHDQVVARDDAERLVLALRSISPRDRWLIQLRDVDGVSVADIADTMGLNDNAVRQQLFRARRRLANAYTALGGDRRGGLVAAIGLRFREFTRRHGHLFNVLGPSSSGVFAAVAPALAAIVGGVLFTATAPPVVVRPARSAVGTAEREVPHWSAAATSGSAVGGAVAAPGPGGHPPPEDPTLVAVEHHMGPNHAKGFVEYPLNREPGGRYDIHVVVYVPGYGPQEVRARERSYDGYPVVCRLLPPCPTAVPTPVRR